MGITDSYLTILSESLDKKIAVLEELTEINREQSELIKSNKFDDEAYHELAEKKDECINNINKMDEGFQLIYDKVKAELEANRAAYAVQIKELQAKISRIMEMSSHLQVEEKRNYEAVKSRLRNMKEEVKQTRMSQKTVANYYKTMNYAAEPVFMDKKK